MYGKFINGVLYRRDTYKSGYKLLVFTEAPDAPEGYVASCYWVEHEETIVQTWDIVPEPNPDPEATPADYEAALTELGVTV